MLLLHYLLGFVFLKNIILYLILQTIEQLILQDDLKLAKQLLNDNAWKIGTLNYNDLMATILYGEDNFDKALQLLSINEMLLKNDVSSPGLLLATQFQMANCYHALNNVKKARNYYTLLLNCLEGNDPLFHEIQQILNY